MPESELLDDAAVAPSEGDAEPDAAAVVDRLARAVERLLGEFEAVRERAARAEDAHAQLSEALRQSELDPADPGDLERRLQSLADENRRLREVIDEARERASLIRRRLMVVEDEL